MRARRGQATVEFAMVAILFLGTLLAVIDLARAGLMQHNLDGGVGDLAHQLASINGTNSSIPSTFAPTPLNPTTAQPALAHAAAMSGSAIGTAPFVLTSPMTLTNGQVTVTATPDLTNTALLTVTATAPFTPAVGFFLGGKTFTLSAREADVSLAQVIQ